MIHVFSLLFGQKNADGIGDQTAKGKVIRNM